MAKARRVKQLSFTMPNKVGLLAEVSSAISGAGVNITSIWAYEVDGNANFVLIADSNAKAKRALAKMGIEVKEEDVVSVEMPNKPGELEKVAKKLSDAGINVNYLYGTTGSGKSCVCIFKTSDNAKAVRVINR
jgi:hypothetical protein